MVEQWRRRRRRKAFVRRGAPLLILAAAGAVLVVLLVASVSEVAPASGSYRRTVDLGYAALASPLVQQSDLGARQLATVLRGAPTEQRAAFFSALDALASSASQVAVNFTQIGPPDPSNSASLPCALTMEDRSRASSGIRHALETLLGGTDGDGAGGGNEALAAAGLSSAGAQLEASDADWARCRSVLAGARGSARLARSVWVPDPSEWSATQLASFVSSVTASQSLAARYGLSVVSALSVPSPLPGTPGALVVPAVTSLGLDVVLQDAGNVDEPGVKLTTVVTPQISAASAGAAGSQGAGATTRTLEVGLRAGSSVAVPVRGVAVSPGSSYTLDVTAGSATVSAPALQSSLVVGQAVSDTLVLASQSPVEAGGTVTYSAQVSTALGGLPPVAGTVEFEDDGAPVPSCQAQPVHSAVALCSVTYASAGVHAVTALYSGDQSRSASTSAPVIENVSQRARSKGAMRAFG